MDDQLNYKQAYLTLFNEVSDIIGQLKAAQLRSEEACTAGGDEHQKIQASGAAPKSG